MGWTIYEYNDGSDWYIKETEEDYNGLLGFDHISSWTVNNALKSRFSSGIFNFINIMISSMVETHSDDETLAYIVNTIKDSRKQGNGDINQYLFVSLFSLGKFNIIYKLFKNPTELYFKTSPMFSYLKGYDKGVYRKLAQEFYNSLDSVKEKVEFLFNADLQYQNTESIKLFKTFPLKIIRTELKKLFGEPVLESPEVNKSTLVAYKFIGDDSNGVNKNTTINAFVMNVAIRTQTLTELKSFLGDGKNIVVNSGEYYSLPGLPKQNIFDFIVRSGMDYQTKQISMKNINLDTLSTFDKQIDTIIKNINNKNKQSSMQHIDRILACFVYLCEKEHFPLKEKYVEALDNMMVKVFNIRKQNAKKLVRKFPDVFSTSYAFIKL